MPSAGDDISQFVAEALAADFDFRLDRIAFGLCTALEFARGEFAGHAFSAGRYFGDAYAQIGKLHTAPDGDPERLAVYERAVLLANFVERVCHDLVFASDEARHAAALPPARKRRARK